MKKRQSWTLIVLITVMLFSCSSSENTDEFSGYSPNFYFPRNGILEFENLNASLVEAETRKFIKKVNHELLINDSSNIIQWVQDSLINGNITRAPNMGSNWQYCNEDKSIQMEVYFCDNEMLELGKDIQTDTIPNQFQRSAVVSSGFGNSHNYTKFNSMFKHTCVSNLWIKLTIIERSIFGNKVRLFDSEPIADTAFMYTFVGPEIRTFLDLRK